MDLIQTGTKPIQDVLNQMEMEVRPLLKETDE